MHVMFIELLHFIHTTFDATNDNHTLRSLSQYFNTDGSRVETACLRFYLHLKFFENKPNQEDV